MGGGSVFISKTKLFEEGEYQNCVLFSGYIIENNCSNGYEK